MEKIKKTYIKLSQEQLDKQFYFNGLSVCRRDYKNLPCPMYTAEFTDVQMQLLIATIYDALADNYYFDEEYLLKYIKNELEDYEIRIKEDIDEAYWKEMENVALNMGMPYYEDIEFIN